ncbi:CPBP family intramembrane glutamic endopeptidase [Microbacterium hydrocarbonoxydans]|uniref:CPBP family intramembrane glutamic endopeptidase n=1 Tax=Microbacterium hydrocarbonoxydans TaxID=273678 RepID=UPI00203C0138|nr:CPBP family intramembrane glutamic endopeptidase [Microbacterium hydrocarbonoxydans]MCM3779750.1 CPBP family intramembrane metalloprotease [Microbacterium hydrocarbonoxydans]
MTDANTALRSSSSSTWLRFWNRGGWWRAVLVAAAYIGLYLGASQLIGILFAGRFDPADQFGSASTVAITLLLPVVVGSLILLAFAVSVKWLPELFGRQPGRGRGWMWIAPVIVVLAAVLRIAGTDWSAYSIGVVLVTFAAGLFIGLSEELLTRGLAVNLLRKGGYSERWVMVLSSLIFALLHSTNLLGGQALGTVLITMAFTFFFGVAMYLTLRVTGSLVWPILLHAITDPTTFLATGGIDTAAAAPNPLLSIAGISVYLYAILTIVALFLVKGHLARQADDSAPLR